MRMRRAGQLLASLTATATLAACAGGDVPSAAPSAEPSGLSFRPTAAPSVEPLTVPAGSSAVDDFAFRLTYQAMPVDGVSPTLKEMFLVRKLIELRLQATGIAAPRVSVQGLDQLVVEAGPATILDEVRALAGAQGRLEFVPLGTTAMAPGQAIDLDQFPPLFSGDQVARATIGADENGRRVVDLDLDDEGRLLLADYTDAHAGDHFAIVLDGTVVMAPIISGPIPGGSIQIGQAGSGGYPLVEAENLVTILRYGQSPYRLQEIQVEGQ
jgi:hypothetical protein